MTSNQPLRYKRIVQTEEQVQEGLNRRNQELANHAQRLLHDRAVGLPALERIVELCETRDSGQIRRLARVLAGLYNGYAYPLDLSNFRCLDDNLLDDCLAVIRMDSSPEREVHDYFENGQARFQNIFAEFGIKPCKT